MTATNHAMTGALIGLLVGNPLVAIPVALLSHFVCDAIPHFGSDRPNEVWLQTKAFKRMLVSDTALCFILVLILAITQPQHWLLACFTAFVAASPDLASIGIFKAANKGLKIKRDNLYLKFASGIQWFEHPAGLVVEATWFACASLILAGILRMR